MTYTCKVCGTRVKIPEEWILLGLNKRIACKICGKQVNLLLSKYKKKESTEIEETVSPKPGTVVVNSNTPTLPNKTFTLRIFKETTGETLMIKEVSNGHTYIFGRSEQTAKTFNETALPILIPTEFDGAVSRIHLLMKVESKNGIGRILIQDLKSKNKTLVKSHGKQQELDPNDQIYIEPNDTIKIGFHTLIKLVE